MTDPIADPSADPFADPFADLDAYLAIPRLGGLVLSPDGTRLVTGVATLDPDRTRYVTALWEVDPAGERPARRLTRSAKGEGGAAFLPDGDLLFVSGRPDTGVKTEDDVSALWLLPAGGGEARVVARRPASLSGPVVARTTGQVVVASGVFPSAVTDDDDAAIRTARKDGKVTAILHETYPIRYWDHDLGPDEPRLFTAPSPAPGDATGEPRLTLQDLTPQPGRCLVNSDYAVTPDGATVLATWSVVENGGRRSTLVAIDVVTGTRRTLLSDPDEEYDGPVVSPSGDRVAVGVQVRPDASTPPDRFYRILDLATGSVTRVAPDWDRWPSGAVWSPDSAALLVVADDLGRCPVFRVDVATGAVTRLTGDHGVYSDVQVSPDGRWVYAVRNAMDAAPAPVRLDAVAAEQEPTFLPSPVPAPRLPGRIERVEATAEDGTPVGGWLCLPATASAQDPAPLLVWIHGGPLGSANGWAWRWNPWLMVARGYAVVQPDFALSTGYGREFVRRGWGRWGAEPYTDLMAVTDETVRRSDVDADLVAAMGGSFGGYLANWVAGHTDRFRGIVTHASLWALDQFGPTTDAYHYWRRELTPAMADANSPHRFVDRIRTPLLVIHGDKDYRVPIGEGLRLWAELSERFQTADGGNPHKFLYFPDENHWVLTPNHAKLWYATVFAFLDTTVLGRPWVVPDLLR